MRESIVFRHCNPNAITPTVQVGAVVSPSLTRPQRQRPPGPRRAGMGQNPAPGEQLAQTDFVHCVTHFWWFGYAHYVPDLAAHEMTAKLGPNALDLTLDQFRALLRGRRGAIKSFLLNQKRIAGIGNVYVQDPLFKAGIHPLRPINALNDDEVAALWQALGETLQESIDHGGSAWELNLYGEKGGWDERFLLVGYREGQPCPACGTTVVKIETGSTSSYICPNCQRLEGSG
jgi:formamidopyrimidine-DNA glycosylase